LTACFAWFLWSFSYLPGTDAYYYALQAQALRDSGHLKVPDHGAIHYAVAAAASLGLPIESSFRAILTIVFAAYQAGMALLFAHVKPPTRGLAALLWIFTCPLIMVHTIEFPSLTFALATLPLWFRLATKPTRGRTFGLAAMIAAGVLLHPAAAALSLLFAAALAAERVEVWRVPRARRVFKILAVAGLGYVVLTWALSRYTGLELRLSSMRMGMPALLGLMHTTGVPFETTFTSATLWVLLSFIVVTRWRVFQRKWLFLAVAALALPLWPDSSQGLGSVGGRLALMFAFLALPLLFLLTNRLAASEPAGGTKPEERNTWPRWTGTAWAQGSLAAIVAIVLALLPLRLQSYRKLLQVDDYDAYEKVVTALHDVQMPMLIAHRGLDFFYSYRLRRDAFHFDPEPNWNQQNVWRLAVRVTPEELAYYSPMGCAWGRTAKLVHGTQYLLVREDCWQGFRAQLNRFDTPDLYTEVWENMENPAQARPAFLRARHPLSVFPAIEAAPR
jgi:hypothetical protein